ncbi:NADH-ubiquinone oxidoreductase chain 4, partial [Gryllus bimaculatus]
AHIEAPISGSMVLASVLLKLVCEGSLELGILISMEMVRSHGNDYLNLLWCCNDKIYCYVYIYNFSFFFKRSILVNGSVYIFLIAFLYMLCINLSGNVEGLGCILGYDLLSYGLILLRIWICGLMIMAKISGRLNPTLFLILGWGYQPDSVEAGFYLLFYTLLASLPLLIRLLSFYEANGTLCFIIAIFLAHIEASISGSMVLASELLKLGGYGLMHIFRVMVFYCLKYHFVQIGINLKVCQHQVDLKSLIAYLSVVNIGMVLGSLMPLNS